MKYNYFIEIHKYIRYQLFELQTLAGKTDPQDMAQVKQLKHKLDELIDLLAKHAGGEDRIIGQLFEQKNSTAYQAIDAEHHVIESQLKKLSKNLNDSFYLLYTDFVGEYLKHMFKEETVLMPALYEYYSEEELRAGSHEIYRQMTQQELDEMTALFFPHINPIEQAVMLSEIAYAQSQKS